jgi:hypothetical protein
MYLEQIRCGGMDCIDLAQNRNQCRALVNAVKIFGFIMCWVALE